MKAYSIMLFTFCFANYCLYSKNDHKIISISIDWFSCAGEPKVALAQIDPLQISRMQIKQGGKSPVNVEINFNNVKLHGLRNFVLNSIRWVKNK